MTKHERNMLILAQLQEKQMLGGPGSGPHPGRGIGGYISSNPSKFHDTITKHGYVLDTTRSTQTDQIYKHPSGKLASVYTPNENNKGGKPSISLRGPGGENEHIFKSSKELDNHLSNK